jgi:subtilisin family serine protease
VPHSSRPGWLFPVALLLASLASGALGAVARADVASDHPQEIREAARPELAPDRFLIRFRDGVTAEHLGALRALELEVRATFPELRAIAVQARGAEQLAALQRDPHVEGVEQEPMRYPLDLFTAQLVPAAQNGLYGLVTTRATAVHSRGITGTGINVGVADTSLEYTHPDIAPNYRGGIDIVAHDNDPINDDGETHGTHVAGTILGASNAQGVLGVAYSANLYHARVLGPKGGSTSDVMAGVRWLVETAKCQVVNLSLGGGAPSPTEQAFYEEMRGKGALIVCAAGNGGSNRISYPAAYTANIAVGAVDRTNAIASFSNRGAELDVVAPGVAVLSAVPHGRGAESAVTTSTTFAASGMTFAGTITGSKATLVDCGLGLAGEFPSVAAGNIALIKRGDFTFAEKVTHAMDAGAVAAIIYNNVPGDYAGTLGTATTSDGRAWIPALAVSDTAGASLKSQVGSYATVDNKTSDWAAYSGTSMATPHVTGVIALIWSANPVLSNAVVEQCLFTTCTDLGAAGFDTTFGWGIVNADAAVRAAASG